MTLTPKDLIKEEIFNSHTGKYEIKKVTVETSKVADELNLIRKQDVSMITMKQMLYNLEMMLRGK